MWQMSGLSEMPPDATGEATFVSVIDLEGRKQHVAVHREDVRVRYGDLFRSARFAGDGVGRFDLTLHTASAHAVILIFD